MQAIQDFLIEIFNQRKSGGPFLFVGSGLSRRYLGAEDWSGLLRRFCVTGKEYAYYKSKANSDEAVVARLLAEDFHEYWWNAEEYRGSVEEYESLLIDQTSPLRFEISKHLVELSKAPLPDKDLEEEVSLLKNLNADGIITTNWDTFLEDLTGYTPYIGQNELLFSNPLGIAEIYKIHGCCTQPHSLVLTDGDYKIFDERSAYLAAKLTTIFVEHPIVFLGYSLHDKNVNKLLKQIWKCVGSGNLEQLRRNLIFVRLPIPDGKEEIVKGFYDFEGDQIPITDIQSKSFIPIYKAINSVKRRIPTKVLRLCKEQFYELVASRNPEEKIEVANFEDLETRADIEFVVGVGVSKNKTAFGDKAHVGIDLFDLYDDLMFDNNPHYDAKTIVEKVIPNVGINNINLPIFKYLRKMGIDNGARYRDSGRELDRFVKKKLQANYSTRRSAPTYLRDKYIQDLVSLESPSAAAEYILCLESEKVDLGVLLKFLIENRDQLNPSNSKTPSSFKKLAAFYDKLKYGW